MGVIEVEGVRREPVDQGRLGCRQWPLKANRRSLGVTAGAGRQPEYGDRLLGTRAGQAKAHGVEQAVAHAGHHIGREVGEREAGGELPELLGEGHSYTSASGRTGEPVAPVIGSGTRMIANSKCPPAAS